jgi:predicted nucleic acid-binding protein
MRYVLDASAALCWVLPRPNSGKALQLQADFLNAVHELFAPSVFSGEVASALTKAERQKLISFGERASRSKNCVWPEPNVSLC